MFKQNQLVRLLFLFGLVGLSTLGSRVCADGFPWERYGGYPNAWYEGFEAKQIASNVLSYQAANGAWPKNVDTSEKKFEGDPTSLVGTFEGGATVNELRFLARILRVTNDEKYRVALEKGLKNILDAQYTTGGWPQSFPPPPKSYQRQIAFDDTTIVNLLQLLREVPDSQLFSAVKKETKDAARTAFDRGVECILKCQIEVKGDLTGWCAWHDEKTFQPKPGRAFEEVSISGHETAAILSFLMTLPKTDANVVRSVQSGCDWLDNVKQVGITIQKQDGDIKVVRDNDAPPLWARFYEIGTNRPIFVKRDGTVKYKLADLEPKLRAEVAWYGPWGRPTLQTYAQWKDRQ